MRKNNQFQLLLGSFLSEYLPSQRNFSTNTISSYCDAFRLFIAILKSDKGIEPNRVKFKDADRETVTSFLNWLETERKCSASTINQRLAAIHSFYKYVQGEEPQLISLCQQTLNIPNRKSPEKYVSYLGKEDLELILRQPDTTTSKGRRDLTLLCVLYDTGGRVQEIADLTVSSVRLQAPAQIKLVGKGNKTRIVPLMEQTTILLSSYMQKSNLLYGQSNEHPVFFNHRHEALTRSGIGYILQKYAAAARNAQPTIPEKVTPHILRHSKAMHLLEAGVNIVYIRDILGHVNIATTGIYARSNLEMKRKALEKVAFIPDVSAVPFWTEDKDLLSWLEGYGKSL
jgi:site-specific recombinase XerD